MGLFIDKYYSAIFTLFLLAIIGLSFGIGYQEGKVVSTQSPIVFSCPNTVLDNLEIKPQVLGVFSGLTTNDNSENQKSGVYVGSKNGTKYYTPGCPGTNRIKPENYIWFQSIQDATLQGYSKGSC